MKIGTGWGTEPERDVARVSEVRDALGDGPELFVDANGAYATKQAARLGRRFEGLGVTWFEEPVSSEHLESLALLRRLLVADVAAGEYGYDLAYFADLCRAGAVDVVQADVTRCGGITEWVRIASVAAAHGLQISGHCAPSAHAHVAASVTNLAHLEYFADHVRVERILFDGPLDPVDGSLRLCLDRPGSGIDLKEVDAGPYLVDA
jgi:L-alanine-DL-glutamate epimerase-like enolase superfamily enzyme